MRILSVVLFLWAAVSSAQLPRIDVSADFDSAGNPSAKFAINTKQFNMPTIRLYPHKAGSAWSPAGLVWYMSYGRNNSVTNLITIGPGSVSSTYVDFSPSATTFAQTVNNGYAVFSCQTTNGQPVSFADGSITIERAPEMFVGNNILLGSTTGTGPVNWSLFSHYLGTWPFYAGTNTTIGYTSTGIVISSSINTNYFNSSVVGGSNVIVVVVTNGQEKTYTVHSSGGGTIDYIQFNTNYTDGPNTARMQWNADDGTVELGLPGGTVNLQLGQEQLIYVRNVSGVTISNGQVVARTGQIGNSRPNVSLADADSTNAYLRIPIGVATETIADNQSGYVTSAGLVRDVNTAGFMGGVPLYLSTTPGQLTTTIPGYPLDAVMIGESIMSNAVNGILHVQISPMKTYAMLDAQYESRTNVAVLGLAVTNNNSVRIAADAALTSSVLSLTASLGNVSGRVVTVEGYTNAAAQGAAAFAWGNHATGGYASAANLSSVSASVATVTANLGLSSNAATAGLTNEAALRIGADAALSSAVAAVSADLGNYMPGDQVATNLFGLAIGHGGNAVGTNSPWYGIAANLWLEDEDHPGVFEPLSVSDTNIYFAGHQVVFWDAIADEMANLGSVSNTAVAGSNQAALAQSWAQAGSNLAAAAYSLASTNVPAGVVVDTDAIYTDTVWKAANAVQSNDSAYTNAKAKATSAVQPTDSTYTQAVARAATAYGWGDHAAAGYATTGGVASTYATKTEAATLAANWSTNPAVSDASMGGHRIGGVTGVTFTLTQEPTGPAYTFAVYNPTASVGLPVYIDEYGNNKLIYGAWNFSPSSYLTVTAAQTNYFRKTASVPSSSSDPGLPHQVAIKAINATSAWVYMYFAESNKWMRAQFNDF